MATPQNASDGRQNGEGPGGQEPQPDADTNAVTHECTPDVESAQVDAALVDEIGKMLDSIDAPQEPDLKQQRAYEILTKAALYYHSRWDIGDGHAYRDKWLVQHYGYSVETIDQLKIGWADGTLYRYLRAQGYCDDDLFDSGLFAPCGLREDYFQMRIVFPYWEADPKTKDPRCVYMIGRKTEFTSDVEHEQGKYKKLPVREGGAQNVIYNLDDGRKRNKILVIPEGVADAVSTIQAGWPTISPVTTKFSERDIPLLVEACNRAGVSMLVPDQEANGEGMKGATRTAVLLAMRGIDARMAILPVPDSLRTERPKDWKVDANDFLKERGADRFKAVIESTPPLLDSLIGAIPSDARGPALDDAVAAIMDLSVRQPAFSRDAYVSKLKKQLPSVRQSTLNAALKAATERMASEQPKTGAQYTAARYVERHGGISLITGYQDNKPTYRELTNFTARIEAEAIRDDGAEATRVFRVAGKLDGAIPLVTTDVPASKWHDRDWVTTHWGARAIVEAGRDTWDHARVAIQQLSDPEECRVYTHTGWRQIEGRWEYLIDGWKDDLRVEADPQGRYRLPPPAASEDLRDAVRTSLATLSCGPDSVTIPIYAAIWTAVLASWLEPDFSLWVVGDSGTIKSGIVGVEMQHFGAFNYANLPGNWKTTANALEAMLFRLKDCCAVIDNYIPGLARDIEPNGNRIVQGIGDRSGRDRLDRNANERKGRPPRGLMIATGEDHPRGASASTPGRMIVVRVRREEIRLHSILSASRPEVAQAMGQAMRAYLSGIQEQGVEDVGRWVASRRDEHAKELFANAVRGCPVHKRTARNLSTLYAGYANFVLWAAKREYIDHAELEHLYSRARLALSEVARAQTIEDASPVDRYLSALRALLAQNRASLSKVNDELETERGIGWLAPAPKPGMPEVVYLDPDLSWKAVADFYGRDKWSFSAEAVYRTLVERGLVFPDPDGRHQTVKRAVAGRRPRVLEMARTALADAIRGDTTMAAQFASDCELDSDVVSLDCAN